MLPNKGAKSLLPNREGRAVKPDYMSAMFDDNGPWALGILVYLYCFCCDHQIH